MNTDEILRIFALQLTDNLARLQSRPKSDNRDVVRIFGPTFASIASLTKGTPPDLSEVAPAAVSLAWVRGTVSLIVDSAAPSPDEMAECLRRQAELEAELEAPMRQVSRPPLDDFRTSHDPIPPTVDGTGEWV